ncbi:MAG: OmpA family protein [Gammaproteobacteria bacterium]|nr:OmpA family protein [Gammaproteobacteria bacterium]
MKNKIRLILVGAVSFIVLLASYVSQGADDALVKEREALAEKIRALEAELALTQKEKDKVAQELEAAKERIDATNKVIIGSYERMMDTKSEAALYEKLVNSLAAEVESRQITIQQMQSGVILNLPEAVLFDSGSSQVKQSGTKVLNKVARELLDVPYQTVVGGFTDNVPISKRLAQQFPSNWDLAAARATSVVRLLENSGVPKGRLVVVSLGENQPIASNDTAEGRAQNRRIEIRLRPVIIENAEK